MLSNSSAVQNSEAALEQFWRRTRDYGRWRKETMQTFQGVADVSSRYSLARYHFIRTQSSHVQQRFGAGVFHPSAEPFNMFYLV